MKLLLPRAAVLLFCSGFCALVYQVVWLRELRLIFGGSTAASAVVLAAFMGGLGLGSAVLGKRADRHPRPLALYGKLELLIAVSAALSPLLIWLARAGYIAVGGASVLGDAGATVVRLLLSMVILGVPTFLMGGTLPAAARAAETADDLGRRHLAVLYGVNTLGAVTGAFVATFVLLEVLGARACLLSAAGLNVGIAVAAILIARSWAAREAGADAAHAEPEPTEPQPAAPDGTVDEEESRPPVAPPRFVLTAAALVGFVFFLMEMVWYRMLTPILGGTTYTFGLILAIALLGIGLGSAFYSTLGRRRVPTLSSFALTCTLEAACLAVPYALGDNLAILALQLRSLGAMGFGGFVLSWTVMISILVLPAAFVSGVQFPMLVALLGRGREAVGSQVGMAYAWNTVGAIVGSLAGGFGFMPLFTAPGLWVLTVTLLVGLGAAALFLHVRQGGRRTGIVLPALCGVTTALLLIVPVGPTAAWRHSGVGAGRVTLVSQTQNGIRNEIQRMRLRTRWQRDGKETAVAISVYDSMSFLVNGKTDGNAKWDSPTQVMSGLVGALIRPDPRRAMVIGLGTGSTVGWLGKIQSIERVDCVELEGVILEVAEWCKDVNEDVLRNPKVSIRVADAREVLLTTPESYDLIFSEPSNPWGLGIASLYTHEFYEAAAQRLEPGGLYINWLQGYQIDPQTVRTVLATLSATFPYIQVWQSNTADMLMIASKDPIVLDADDMRARIQTEPFKEALAATWRVNSLEGVLARFVADTGVARAIAELEAERISTDDRNLVEFGFARAMGRLGTYEIPSLRALARRLDQHRPPVPEDAIEWSRLEDEWISMYTTAVRPAPVPPWFTEAQRIAAAAHASFLRKDYLECAQLLTQRGLPPVGVVEVSVTAGVLAELGDARAVEHIAVLRETHPAEADALLGVLHDRQGQLDESVAALERAFAGFRADPWSWEPTIGSSTILAKRIARRNPEIGKRLAIAMGEPFAAYCAEEARLHSLIMTLSAAEEWKAAAQIMGDMEPNVFWDEEFLRHRVLVYETARDPLLAAAVRDLGDYLRREPIPLDQGIR